MLSAQAEPKVRGHGGYVGEDEIPRLNVLDLQRLIRVIPKPVVAMVAGYAIGGGHVLHVVCDLTIALTMLALDKLDQKWVHSMLVMAQAILLVLLVIKGTRNLVPMPSVRCTTST